MLKFAAYRDGQPVNRMDLSGAYLFGQDRVPVRADLAAEKGEVCCIKRAPGACGLVLLWDAGESGRFLLPTTRLPERQGAYNLNLEVARAVLGMLFRKYEEWGLFDYQDAADLNRELTEVRRIYIEALEASEAAEMASRADEAVARGVTLGERMALFHADVLLKRRKNAGPGWMPGFGCRVDLFSTGETYAARMREAFDFIAVPVPWKHAEPREHQFQYSQIDAWINWAAKLKKPVHAGPLISFEPAELPEWLYLWEGDYDSLRDVIYDHVERVVQRYRDNVQVWNVVSGIHAHNSFDLNFEQIMELTRLTCGLVKRLAPQSEVVLDLVMPWGEYYARNQRTIPPLLYADMAVQSGVKFDTIGLQMYTGVPVDGYYVRDLMQISSLLDEFVSFGKPVRITGCQAPSDVKSDPWDAWDGEVSVTKAGKWHAPWSPLLQAEWVQAFSRVCISKPFVQSICWRDLADYEGHFIPHGGLCRNNLEPKLAFRELRNFRAWLHSSPAPAAEGNQQTAAEQADGQADST
ncbi:MAG: endo-1,4-beta-xylanase [Phycisphaerae bacterium]